MNPKTPTAAELAEEFLSFKAYPGAPVPPSKKFTAWQDAVRELLKTISEPTSAREARQLVAAGLDWLKAHGRSYHETLGDPRAAAEMAELKAAIKADPEVGARLVREAGIWDENNKLTPKFGGEPREKENEDE